MTKIDETIVGFIIDYYRKNQFYPSYDEIADGIGRAKATVHVYMKKLEAEGIIVRKSDRSSRYRLINMDFIRRHEPMESCGTGGTEELSSFDAGIREQIDGMMKHVCDGLCKYPIMLSDQEDLDDVCDECELGGYVCRMLNFLEKDGGK